MGNKKNKFRPSVFFQNREEHNVLESGKDATYLSHDIEAQLRSLLDALKAVKQGDFSIRLPPVENGVIRKIAEMFNDVLALNENMANEIVDYSKRYTVQGNSGFANMMQFWVKKEKLAFERGFAGLRLAGNTYWLERNEWKDFKNLLDNPVVAGFVMNLRDMTEQAEEALRESENRFRSKFEVT